MTGYSFSVIPLFDIRSFRLACDKGIIKFVIYKQQQPHLEHYTCERASAAVSLIHVNSVMLVQTCKGPNMQTYFLN